MDCDSISEMSSESVGDSSGDAVMSSEQQRIPHPWPYLREMFDIVGTKGQSWKMTCKLCLPKRHELLAFKNSPSNLKKHVERKHTNQLEKYSQLTSRRLPAPEESPPSKQPKLWETRRVSQASVDKVIINFVIQGLHPLSVVEQKGFQDLVLHLQPDVSVMCRGTVKNRVEKAAQVMKKTLKTALDKIEFIATTTDCWTSHRRSFIGVTAHWIEPQMLTRRCAALACKQLKGSHTFTALASALNDIHTEFNIREKITRTTTDNGSNFVKAFRVFGPVDENHNLTAAVQSSEVGDEEKEEEEEEEVDDEMGGADVEFVDVEAILDEDDSLEYQLPKHHRCACHLLNLVSTVDVSNIASTVYKRLSRSSFAKCTSLWNKSARSTTAAEVIEDKCKLQLLRPNDTRWNSLFMAVERIIRISREQGEGAIAAVCSALKIPMFSPVELAFLAEYVKTMSPVAKALDLLQGESNVQMGWLVPTITLLKEKLQRLHISIKFCGPLVDALLAGLEKRFGEMLRDPELIAAAILVPKFKTSWTSDECVLKLGLDFIKGHLKEQAVETGGETSHSSEEDDFFSSIKQNPTSQENTKQLETYLGYPGDTVRVLASFPTILNLSIRLNTPLPASAACERLFSTAGLIFTPKRARVDSKNFENQLLLKLNRGFC